MSSPTPHSYRLPDLHFLCPWKASFNPHHGEAATASSEWVLSYAQSAIGSGDRLEFFQQKGSKLLAAWAYPYAGPEQLRTCCDFINLTYVIDEASDRQDGKDARSTAVTVLNTTKDDAYDDGTILCSMTKDFKQRFFPYTSPITSRRFLENTEIYLNAVAKEAELREKCVILDSATYDNLRRENSGVPYSFALFGYTLGADLPDKVFNHPIFQEMYLAAVDMVTRSNHEKNITLQEAADYVGAHFKELIEIFEAGKTRLPSFGKELGLIISKYVTAVECWAIGNIEWCFWTRRYFGGNHVTIRETLLVELWPPRAA